MKDSYYKILGAWYYNYAIVYSYVNHKTILYQNSGNYFYIKQTSDIEQKLIKLRRVKDGFK